MTRPASRPPATAAANDTPNWMARAFDNDTTPRYNEAAAHEAWSKTIALFKRTLA